MIYIVYNFAVYSSRVYVSLSFQVECRWLFVTLISDAVIEIHWDGSGRKSYISFIFLIFCATFLYFSASGTYIVALSSFVAQYRNL
jgi:hypothetical protein